MRKRKEIDRRDLPAYSLPEAGRYLDLATSTLREWVSVRGLLVPASSSPLGLSFNNLVEAHTLGAMRFEHRLSMKTIVAGLGFVQEKLKIDRPLLDPRFETDGIDLFLEEWGRLVTVNKRGQVAWRFMVQGYLSRIQRDTRGIPVRLFPIVDLDTRSLDVSIDIRFSFGRPTVASTGIMTSIIAERRRAGESVSDLMDDYNLTEAQVQTALRYEGFSQAA